MGRGEDSRVSGGSTERKKVNLTEQEANRREAEGPGWGEGVALGWGGTLLKAHCSVATTGKHFINSIYGSNVNSWTSIHIF